MKRQPDYTLLALAICFLFACAGSIPGCYNQPKPKRQLLEFTYHPIVNDSTKETGSVRSYTIDAIYLDGKDTVTVYGITQSQYDSLQISE